MSLSEVCCLSGLVELVLVGSRMFGCLGGMLCLSLLLRKLGYRWIHLHLIPTNSRPPYFYHYSYHVDCQRLAQCND